MNVDICQIWKNTKDSHIMKNSIAVHVERNFQKHIFLKPLIDTYWIHSRYFSFMQQQFAV